MTKEEQKLYGQLRELTDLKDRWQASVAEVGALLQGQSAKITAKALWLLGEMGLAHPQEVAGFVPRIAAFLRSEEPLLRARALNALGRIGRADYALVAPFWREMCALSKDPMPKVRLSLIWAAENIASSTPEFFACQMELFARFLDDPDDKVRMEAPEIFRVLGKRIPELVCPWLEKLAILAQQDLNRVVRIHAAGAIKATRRSARLFRGSGGAGVSAPTPPSPLALPPPLPYTLLP